VLLALDTATPTTTVAVAQHLSVLAEQSHLDGRRHAEVLAPMIVAVLSRAQVDVSQLSHIAVGVGPGPFTGLRVGLVTALAMGDALAVPVLGVVTLDVIAAQALTLTRTDPPAPTPLLAVTDARRHEVYWARYDDGRRTAGPAVGRAAEVAAANPQCRTAGEGAERYASEFEASGCVVVSPQFPSAAALAVLAEERLRSDEAFEPVVPRYLRQPDARVPGERKRVTPR
jgi:tRNA threonylcarbamoyl adenosine modification protein YeaZ